MSDAEPANEANGAAGHSFLGALGGNGSRPGTFSLYRPYRDPCFWALAGNPQNGIQERYHAKSAMNEEGYSPCEGSHEYLR
jgi:hypothetical protein